MRKKVTSGNFAKRIIRLRQQSGLSQAAFGEIIGVTQQHIGALEAGKRQPSGALLIAISYKFNVREAWIKSGKGKPFNICSN